MSHEKSADVGCGMTRYTRMSDGRVYKAFYLVCNYSFTNLVGEPIYHKGPSCSECKTGCNPDFEALCNIAEPTDPRPDGDIAASAPKDWKD